MEVYIEVVFLNNFFINVLILYATAFIDKRKAKTYRLLISGAVGGIFSVLYPFLSNSIFVKIGISIIMIIILKHYRTFKELIYTLLIFYIITFTLGGGVLMLTAYAPFDVNLTLVNYKLLPFAVGIIGSGILFFSEKLHTYVNKNKNVNQFIYKVEIENEDIDALAYYDTGNKLYYNGQAVIVLSERLFKKTKLKTIGKMEVGTINGIKECEMTELTIKITDKDKKQQKFTTKAVISSTIDNKIYDVILHKDTVITP